MALSDKYTLWSKTWGCIPNGVATYSTRKEAENALRLRFRQCERSDIKIIKMVETEVEIKVHPCYVQTCVRFYGDTALTYKEYGMFGSSIPQMVFLCATKDELKTFVENVKEDAIGERSSYLPDFDGWLRIQILFPDAADLSNFEVEEARYVSTKKAGRDIKGAFRDPKFKRPIMDNLLKQIAEKNVAKLTKVLGALDIVGA